MDDLEKSKQQDYYRIMLPEIPMNNINKFVGIKEKSAEVDNTHSRVKTALTLPGIADDVEEKKIKPPAEDTNADILADTEEAAAPPPILNEVDVPEEGTTEDKTIELLLDIADAKNELQNLEREIKINDSKEEILDEVNHLIRGLRKELEDLKSRKVPVRKEYETENSYKEQLYPQAVNVLDDIIVPLIDAIPDYNLVATQISTTFDDGTIKNGIVTISIVINNNDFRHDFKVDVPVLNGLLQSPLYITRGRKVIPLTAEALYEELNSESFVRISPTYRQKDNMFSNIGQNILRKHDDQKLYPTYQHEMSPHSKPLDGTWVPNKQRGIGNE